MRRLLYHATLILGLLLVAYSPHSVHATPPPPDLYISTTGVDSGPCSVTACLTLQYAYDQAVDGTTIHIAAGIYATNFSFAKNLTLSGAGMTQTVFDGGTTGRVIENYATYTLNLNDLTIKNGDAAGTSGGGILNYGTVNLQRVKVTQNVGTDGGGIYSSGAMTISDSVISDNTASKNTFGKGGGIYFQPATALSVTLDRVTVSGNTSSQYGGGIYNQGASGSLFNLQNVTLNGNSSAYGGAIGNFGSGSLSLLNTTVADNTIIGPGSPAGIFSLANISFKNTLISANTPDNCNNSGGTWTSLGNNLDSGTTCNFNEASDLESTDPLLVSLSDNGGITPTNALLGATLVDPLSPAIDAGSDSGVPTTDQRGLPRTFGSHTDIGAYEYTLFTISGNAGIANAVLSYTDNTSKTSTANGSGDYAFTVNSYWSGAVTPSLTGYKFTPNHKDYTNVWSNQTGQSYTYSNPVPVLSSISPTNKWSGRPGLTLILFGTKFTPASVVRWNGSPRVTTFVNTGKLTAAITTADLATASIATVTVFNPTPGGGTSVTKNFTVKNDVPVITGLSPASKIHGKPGFTLTVYGKKFSTGAKVRWNGSDRPTTFVNMYLLTAAISATDIATAGTANVRVFNPTPGGGLSNAMTFTIQ